LCARDGGKKKWKKGKESEGMNTVTHGSSGENWNSQVF
jgi:hypothetical protein